jgi:hypothetical protein
MVRQLLNLVLLVGAIGLLLVGGAHLLGMMGFLPQGIADTVLQAIYRIVAALPI